QTSPREVPTMRMTALLLACAAVLSTGCHPGPILGNNQPSVGGTIAGVVKTTDSQVAIPGRKITVVEMNSGVHLDTTTATNGGYAVKVPEGTYRIDIELHDGERLVKRPEPTHINNGDLDSGRDFVITAAVARR